MSRDPNNSSPRQTLPVWWIASLIFHALLLGWLFFFSPVRVIDLAPGKSASPGSTISPARAAQVMEQVRERQAGTLAGEVRALEEAKRELSTLEAQRRDTLRLAATNAPVPVEQIVAAQESAVKAQTAAEAALKQANAQVPPDATGLSSLTNATSAIREAQTDAGQFQAEALEALALADPKFEAAYQAQAAANAAQLQADQAQAEAEGQFIGAARLRAKSAPGVENLAAAKELLRAAQAQLAVAISNSVALSNSLPQLRAEASATKAAFDAAQASGDKARISSTKRRASDSQKVADNTQRNLARALNDITRFQSRLTEQTSRVAKFSAEANPLETNRDALQRSAAARLRTAQQLQATALASQVRAAKVFAEVRNGTVSAPAPTAPIADDLAGVYQAAVRTEAELAEAYRRLRATDLAMQREIPLAWAMELTDAARPARPDLAAALGSSPNNGANVAAQRQAVREARSQIAAMRSLADSMLSQARALGAGAGQPQTLEQLAVEDDNQRAKDLTGAMRSSSGPKSGKSSPAKASTASSAGSAGASGSGGSPSGATSGSGSGLGLGGSGDGSSSGPPPVPKDLAAVPGRVIGAGAVPGRWMFVDSWYLLGPFDNAGRANIEKQFPPETVVDLNATYVGKRGQPVRWAFHQSPQPRVVPPFDKFNPLANGAADGGPGAFVARDLEYIIYYGYTELRTEADCDVWIAVGSDDFSKLWIEDQLVWASGKQHKSWRVDEGFRKVRLKRGVNRVLFRVENGQAQSEFSLVVCSAN
jgi:hypothetical protein